MTFDDPFTTLGIAPTLDLGTIKRGYFAALAARPPHRDPEAFRRVRAAYDALTSPEGRTLAFLRAPVDVPAEFARFEATWGERIAEASGEVRAERDRAQAVERFMKRVLRSSLADIVGSRGERAP
jgi:curved DNA-binding protein CbpA